MGCIYTLAFVLAPSRLKGALSELSLPNPSESMRGLVSNFHLTWESKTPSHQQAARALAKPVISPFLAALQFIAKDVTHIAHSLAGQGQALL